MVYWQGKAPTDQEVLDGLLGLKLDAEPGEHSVYSNLGFALLGILIRRLSGKRYEQFVTERVLRPLGMNASTYATESVPSKTLTKGFVRSDKGFAPPPFLWKMGTANAGGGLWSSVEDLAKLATYEMDAGDLSKPWPPVASRTSLLESQRGVGLGAPGEPNFGVSWRVTQDSLAGTVVSHTGLLEAYASVIWVAPKQRLSVIALAGANDGDGIVNVVGPFFWSLLSSLVSAPSA
jgi:CubicO group peptidase (beta-lactamase class C family)